MSDKCFQPCCNFSVKNLVLETMLLVLVSYACISNIYKVASYGEKVYPSPSSFSTMLDFTDLCAQKRI